MALTQKGKQYLKKCKERFMDTLTEEEHKEFSEHGSLKFCRLKKWFKPAME